MEYLSLGKNGPVVSRVCFGSLAVSGPGVSLPPEDGAEIIAYALLRGINFIDTAQYYNNYEVIRRGIELYRRLLCSSYDSRSAVFSFYRKLPEALRRDIDIYRSGKCPSLFRSPDGVVITSKTYAVDRDAAREAVEEARVRLDRDVIDVFLLHEQESADTLRGHSEALEYLYECKEKGIISAVGLSTHCVAAAKAAARIEHSFGVGLDVVFAMYNHTGLGINRDPEDIARDGSDRYSADGVGEVYRSDRFDSSGEADGSDTVGGVSEFHLPGDLSARREMYAALKECHDAGIGVMLMKVFGGGNLLGRAGQGNTVSFAETALRFAASCDAADVLALGMQSFEQIDADIEMVEKGRFPEDFSEGMTGKRRKLKIDDYCIGCGRCVERCGQSALSVIDGKAVCDHSRCVLCGYCAGACPLFALHQTF